MEHYFFFLAPEKVVGVWPEVVVGGGEQRLLATDGG